MEKQFKDLLKQVKLSESTISTILGALVVIIVGVLIFNYFKKSAPKEEITPEAAQEEITFEENEKGEKIPQDLPVKHKVEAGQDLWTIAEKYYGSGYNWVDIAKENQLFNPDKVLVDQELNIPQVPVREPAQVVKATTDNAITAETYKVQKGDNLWSIAVRAYSDGYKWPEIAKANNLANPNYIEVDQELQLPR